ncbi:acyl-CoA dehydrogenase family protein [Kitasatospora sp. NPDC096077]|uniref:acyl-CoA dehydrogenase family protein n=1 Tax=Kitasatospora sp. NPDC096077 TaxID=3155544 RepID=UPI003316DCD8
MTALSPPRTPAATALALTRLNEAAPPERSRRRADEQIGFLREYAPRRIDSAVIDERRCIPPHVALDFGDAGLFGPLIEERHGGTALRFTDLARVVEQLAAIDSCLASWVMTCVFPGTRTLAVWAGAEVAERWLPPLAAGRVFGAFAQTEPGAGTDFTGMTTTAHPVDGGVRLSGTKHWIGNGSWARVAAVVARRPGQGAAMTALAVPLDLPGVRIGPDLMSFGLRGMVQSRLEFDDVVVPASHVLGGGPGTEIAVDAMNASRWGVCALASGFLKRVLQVVLRFVSTRTIAGRRSLERPAVLSALTRIAVHGELTDAMTYALAERLDHGTAVEPELLVTAKVLSSEWAVRAADLGLQLLGARGYDEAQPMARIYRDVRALRIIEGATEALTDFLGTRVLSRPGHVSALLAGLDGEAEADRLDAAVAEVSDRAGRSRTSREGFHHIAAEAAMWGFASALLRSRPAASAAAVAGAASGFETALGRLRSARPTAPAVSPTDLVAMVDRYRDRIADL